MAERFRCDDYVECSAKTLEGIHDVFNSAIEAVTNSKNLKTETKERCKLF